jgi:DNA (cytosine-5)-methyltransferase 1
MSLMDERELTVVSLFSGAGGFDWGFHRAGFHTKLACELEAVPSKTLAGNFNLEITQTPITNKINGSSLVIQGDVRDVDFSAVKHTPDVLIGGPPCQDFSISRGRERAGLNAGRGKLYVEFIHSVMFIQPKVFVFENVPGLTSVNDGKVYETILDDLERLEEKRIEALDTGIGTPVPPESVHGYDILFSDIVDGPQIGVPQTRRRLIIIGIRRNLTDNLRMSEYRKLKKEIKYTLSGRDQLFWKYPLTCIEIFEGKPLIDLEKKYKEVMEAYRDITIDPDLPKAAEWKARVWDKLSFDVTQDYFAANQLDYSEFDSAEFEQAMYQHRDLLEHLGWLNNPVYANNFVDGTQKLPKYSEPVRQRMQRIPPDANCEFVIGTKWEVESKDISFIYRRSAPLKPAWTVMAYGGGGTYGYHYERRRGQLTLREKARIQTFTDDFSFVGPGVRAQIGEAVPPLMAERIAEVTREILGRIEAQTDKLRKTCFNRSTS